MDKMSGMRVFVAVVDNHGFTAASEQLGLSRAAVSKQVAQLEAHLGGRLLNRTTRSVSLTGIGRTYYERCKQILEDVADAECIVSGLSKQPRGTLRINAPMSFGITQLSALLGLFSAAYPEVEIDLSLNDRYVDIVAEGYDLVVRIGQLPDSNLIARRIASCHFVMCASPGYLQQHGRPEHPNDLGDHACLRYAYAEREHDWTLSGPDGEFRIHIDGPLIVDNGNALCTAASTGMGIVLLPTFIASADIENGKLEILMPDYLMPDIGIYAIYPSNRHLSAKVRAFIDFITQQISDPPSWDSPVFDR